MISDKGEEGWAAMDYSIMAAIICVQPLGLTTCGALDWPLGHHLEGQPSSVQVQHHASPSKARALQAYRPVA